MKAFLLCAGFGTRMRPLTNRKPKSLVRVAGHPILDYLTDELSAWDALEAIHLAVNHRDAEAFRAWASGRRADLAKEDVTLHVHDDGVETPDESLGSVGDLGFLLDGVGIPSDGALVSGGDSLYRFPLAPILNAYTGTTNQGLALYEPDLERRAHSSLLKLDGRVVTEVVDDPTGTASPWTCPSWILLSADALETVPSYLEEGGSPDKLGPLLNRIAWKQTLQAIPFPKKRDLRLHCNTMDDLERARRLFQNEPRHLLDAEAVQECLIQREA